MYSLILMSTLSAAPQGPEFNGYFRNLFHRDGGCYGTCAGRGNACYGTCTGWALGSRVRAFFSFGGGCGGCYGSCAGRAAGCFGSAYSCHGCAGSLSCGGGQAFDAHPAPVDYGAPAYPAPTYNPGPFTPYVPGAVPPVRGPGLDGVPFAPNTPAPPAVIDERNAFRGPPVPAGPTRATVVVKLPPDARLYAEGQLLPLASGERTFVTPELPGGQEYRYTFRVEYDRNGETVSQSRRVAVRPGTTTPVEFADLVLAKAPPAPAPKPAAPANTTATKTADDPAPTKEADRPNPFKSPVGATAPAVGGSDRARITVKLPPGATLYIDDKKKEGSSPVREFTTPPLPPGKEFAYLVKVEVMGRHGPEQLFEKVVFRAGETVTRDFANLLSGDQRAGQ